MPLGTVKWFNDTKGWGFIVPDGGGDDLFVHYRSINGNGHRTLKEGERVSFRPERGNKGMQAVDVQRVK